jgi:hypothetical protein
VLQKNRVGESGRQHVVDLGGGNNRRVVLSPDGPGQFAQHREVWLSGGRKRDVSGQHRSLAFDQRLIKSVADHVEILRFEPRFTEIEIVEVGVLLRVEMPRRNLLIEDRRGRLPDDLFLVFWVITPLDTCLQRHFG